MSDCREKETQLAFSVVLFCCTPSLSKRPETMFSFALQSVPGVLACFVRGGPTLAV